MLAYRSRNPVILLGVFLATLGVCPGPARADEPEKSILVLRISQRGKLHDRLTAAVQEYLRRSTLPMASTSGLGKQDRKCNEPSCLSTLADTLHTPLLIVTATISVQQNDRFLEASLFDTASGRNRTAEDSCEQNDVERRLKGMIRQLVDDFKVNATPAPPTADRPAGTVPAATAAVPDSPVAAARPPVFASPAALSAAPISIFAPSVPKKQLAAKPRLLPGWRRGLAAALGTTAALSLGGAISLQVYTLNGKEDSTCRQFLEPGNSCVGNATGLYAGGYALAGVALLGTLLTLTLP